MIFSADAYVRLLDSALNQGWQFTGFMDVVTPSARNIYLRHDVDISLTLAADLARINQRMGVNATFFVMVRADSYNILTRSSLEHLHTILKAGQQIGLHCSPPPSFLGDTVDGDALAEFVQRDFNLLKAELSDVVPVFSWHDTTPQMIEWGLTNPINGLLNTYSQHLFREIPYYSDSNLRNNEQTLTEIVSDNSARALHLLIHPEIWMAGGDTMLEVFAHCWPAIVRELEPGVGGRNRYYRQYLPSGMPVEVAESFSEQLVRSAIQQWAAT